MNALVWRVYQQDHINPKKPSKTGKTSKAEGLSIMRGRSMCVHCQHQLRVEDLIPVFSWLSLKGRCRYCHKPISTQYPLVETLTAILFVSSYLFWPSNIQGLQVAIFISWLILLVGLMALIVYDFKWMLLPNRIMFPLSVLAAVFALLQVLSAPNASTSLLNTALSVIVGGGIFYALFQVSSGRWIGGGDVKLGGLLGLLVATPARSLLVIFMASFIGSFVSIPLMLSGKLKTNSTIPFGPFLIIAAIVTQLFGHDILYWYQHTVLAIGA